MARIKERFQLKMFFPSLFFFPSTSSFPLLSCFPLSSHILFFHVLLIFVAHFSLVSTTLTHFLPNISCQGRLLKKEEEGGKQVVITTTQGLSFALVNTGSHPLRLPNPARNPAQSLTHTCLLSVPALWLTPDEQSGCQQSKGVRSPICQYSEYVPVCNYAGRVFQLLSHREWRTSFLVVQPWPQGRMEKREGGMEEGRGQGRSVNCNQAAQHVRSWTRSTQCQPGMKAALTIPS